MHVVVGAGGAIGSAITSELLRRGERVRVVARRPLREFAETGAETALCDAASLPLLREALKDATHVYYCVNLPYQDWERDAERLLGIALRALPTGRLPTFLLPGNVYVYGRAQTPLVDEAHPLAAKSRKGRVRVRMEDALRRADAEGELRLLILRMPNFYGPTVRNALIEPVFRSALRGRPVLYPGNLDALQEFVLVEDGAKAMVDLALHPSARGVYHLPGPAPITPRRWLRMVVEAAGTRSLILPIGRGLMRVVGLFEPQAREMSEMMYLYERSFLLDGSHLRSTLGADPATPYEEGIARTLEALRGR